MTPREFTGYYMHHYRHRAQGWLIARLLINHNEEIHFSHRYNSIGIRARESSKQRLLVYFERGDKHDVDTQPAAYDTIGEEGRRDASRPSSEHPERPLTLEERNNHDSGHRRISNRQWRLMISHPFNDIVLCFFFKKKSLALMISCYIVDIIWYATISLIISVYLVWYRILHWNIISEIKWLITWNHACRFS